MAKKGVEYRVLVIGDHAEEAEGELNQAAKDGFKIAGTTASAVIMERKLKDRDDDKDKSKDKDDDKDDDDD